MGARYWVLALALLLGTTGAMSANDHSRLIKDLLSANLEARELAEKRLVAIGAPVVPELLRVVATGDFEAAAAATGVILDMGSPATEPLVRGLSGSAKERRAAFSLLVRLGPSAKAAVPAMIVALGEKDRITRRSAAQVLSRIGPPAAAAVPSLTAALKDSSASVRLLAAEALGAIGYRATPARAALSALATDAKQSASPSSASTGRRGPPTTPGWIQPRRSRSRPCRCHPFQDRSRPLRRRAPRPTSV